MGLLGAVAGGVSAAAGAAADYYGKSALAEEVSRIEEEKAARLMERGSAVRLNEEQVGYDRKVSRAPGENQMAVDRADTLARGLLNTRAGTAEQSRSLDAGDAAAKDRAAGELSVAHAGDTARMTAERKLKLNQDIDHGARLRGIQTEAAQLALDRAKLENKIPPAEAKMFDAIKKQIEINETAIAKAQAEGGQVPPEMTKKVSDLVAEQRKLLSPYLKEGVVAAPAPKDRPPLAAALGQKDAGGAKATAVAGGGTVGSHYAQPDTSNEKSIRAEIAKKEDRANLQGVDPQVVMRLRQEIQDLEAKLPGAKRRFQSLPGM